MKIFFLGILAVSATGMNPSTLFAAGSMVGGGDQSTECSDHIALYKGSKVIQVIEEVNAFKNAHAGQARLYKDATYYYVTKSIDLGLSVPTYTVKITQTSCEVLEVEYSNLEG